MSPDEFRRLGHELIDYIADYHTRVESLPVRSRARPGDLLGALPAHAPERAEGWDSILADIDRLIVPGLTHWQSPNFHAYFPANGSFPAILGDLLSTGLGVNGMLWATSPAATELETRVLDWLGEMIDLPASFLSTSPNGGGVIQGTASEGVLVALAAARARAMKVHARSAATTDLASRLTLYTSAQAHSSVVKAAMIAGLAAHPEDRRRVRLIGTGPDFAMNPGSLGAAMAGDVDAGLVPFFVCATVGTTSSTAIDPLDRIGPLCAAHDDRPWLHVDAAMAGAACICPEFRHMLRGVEHADTVSFNPHKWMLTSFDCTALWTRDRASIINALSVTPEYLRNAASSAGEVVDYRDWQVPLGRRFRALKLWFVIRHYGVEGLRAHIREHMRIAGVFEGLVRGDPRFEVVTPRTITLVCFRLRAREGEGQEESNKRNAALLESINASGKAMLSHTVLPIDGRPTYMLRMAIGASGTQERHIQAAWRVIVSSIDERA
ncbi:MAG: aspartate aminotransferase family protein [Phycisphaerales bacterium]|nr:aspartate aminotransferase family protein [Phycisphaerales bacterium]